MLLKLTERCEPGRLELRMFAAGLLHTSRTLTKLRLGTACRSVLDASASRARSPMLAHDLPTSARVVSLHQLQASGHFGRAAYCTSSHLTGRSLTGRTDPRLRPGCSKWATTAAQARCHQRFYVCAATSVVNEPTAASTSQRNVPKFARRTSVKDVKVDTRLPCCEAAFCCVPY